MSGFEEIYWAKQMSDALTVFECESETSMVKLFDGLLRWTSDNKYLNWTCRTECVPISRTLISNGTYWCELLGPPLEVVIKFLFSPFSESKLVCITVSNFAQDLF